MKRLLYLCFLILPVTVLAQKKEANAAFKGYKANYIYNFFKPASLQHPDGEVIGFRLDRKLESEATWQTIQRFSTPATYDELAKNLQVAQNQVFEYRPESAYGVDEFWPIYEKTHQYDSIAVYLTQQPVALAFKLLLADTNVNNAAAYKYRLVQIKKDNTEGNGYITTAVSPGFKYLAGKPKIKDRNLNGGSYRFVFKAKATAEIPEAILVKRKEEGSTKFERILPYYTIVQDRDSIIYTIADDKVREGALYQYAISPVNRYGGGAAIVSDTVSAFSMDQKMLIPKIFTATTDSIKHKIVLNWGFFRPELISLTEVYRSENYETGYEYIGTSDKGVFVDQTAITGKKYYYYLEITDQLGRTSERSTKIFGLVQSDKKPSAPIYVNLIKSKTGNVLSWQDYNEETRGFRVYRTNQLEGELIPISDFIFKNERQTGQYSFTDTSTNITGNVVGYAVLSENLSNVQSDFSKILYLRPKAPIAISPMLLDVAKDKAAVRLFWQQNNLDRNTASGFNIYRKTGSADFKKINRMMIDGTKASYTDSLMLSNQTLVYKLTAVNLDGGESTFSNEMTVMGTDQIYAPVSLKCYLAKDKSGALDKTGILLEWQPTQSAVSKYEIYRFNRGEDPAKIGEVKAGSHSYKDNSYHKEKNNYYFVVAVDDEGKSSPPSNETYNIAK